jgi:DNA-directed RNA polymerase subunit L
MKSITNLSYDEQSKKVSFLLHNNNKIKISFANAIRRILISDIYVYTISNTVFYENTSMLDNEFLAHRIKQIPINCEYLDTINQYDNITISCKKSNDMETIISIYVSDFVCKNGDVIIENSKVFPYPDIIFGKLKMNQKISFDSKLEKSNQYHGGSFFSPVAQCVHTFDIDTQQSSELMANMSESEKIKFSTQDIERVYSKTTKGEPLIYKFEYICIGFYSGIYLLKKAIEILINKLTLIKKELRNENSNKLYIYQNKENINFIIFDINDENDTIGNLFATYLSDDNEVLYSGYIIEHPLKENILLKIQLKENNTVENMILKITNLIDFLLNNCNDLFKDI